MESLHRPDASTYYDRNALLHNQESSLSVVGQTGRIPAHPSQVDWTVFWLMEVSLPRESKCLDVGCATLTLLHSVEGLFAVRVGVDIAVHANWRSHSEILTLKSDLDRGPLPFCNQAFHAVTMLMTLEHVFNPFHAIRELRRVCRPDGYVIIGAPNIAGIRHRLGLLVGRFPMTSAWFSFEEEAWDGYHLHNFTQASLAWLLRREGLQPLRWASHGRLQFLKRLRPSLFGADLIVLCRPVEPERRLKPRF